MVKNSFNKQQRRVIRQVCRFQINSLLKIYTGKKYTTRLEDLQRMGLIVNSSDFEEKLATNIEKFYKVKENPNDLYKELDNLNISIVKHILFNFIEDQGSSTVKGIWRKMFLSDKVVSTIDKAPKDFTSYNWTSTGKNFNLNHN